MAVKTYTAPQYFRTSPYMVSPYYAPYYQRPLYYGGYPYPIYLRNKQGKGEQEEMPMPEMDMGDSGFMPGA